VEPKTVPFVSDDARNARLAVLCGGMPKASSADAPDAAIECNVPEANRADDDDDSEFQLMLMMLARFVHSRAGLRQIALCANPANPDDSRWWGRTIVSDFYC